MPEAVAVDAKLEPKALAVSAAPLVAPDGSGATHLDDLLARPEAAALAALLGAAPRARRFLEAVFSLSPFLRHLGEIDPDRLAELLRAEPGAALDALIAQTEALWREQDERSLMRGLRRARGRAALLIALADLGRVWSLEQVTDALSRFADAAVGAAVRFLLAQAARAGKFAPADADDPALGSGYIVLAMGKHGAGELNYSSDIDLIVLHDGEHAPVQGVDPQSFFVRLTKSLVKILQERTEDGYVFRVDLRLRPDPGATGVSIDLEAALQYYESMGQNWERAALIKARPVAGDIEAGEAFLRHIAPFVWRRYFDFAAIADVHAMKRQIHSHKGHGRIAVAGHNVKLGRGGIREIEFFVQTQQLIAGGRNPGLRGRRTLDMLGRLVEAGWIDAEARDALREAYCFLRGVEHRLQMRADEQTHTLPDSPEGLAVIAAMCGLADADAFAEAFTNRLVIVQAHYAKLFESAPALSAGGGSLVFTGGDDDPDTLATLAAMGYVQPKEVTKAVRAWHFGRYSAMRSEKAREQLTEITPALLEALAETGQPDAAFTAFDRFLSRLPTGVQLFSLLRSNPRLLRLLATIMGTAPRLTETIVRRAHVVDAVLEPDFFGVLPSREQREQRLDRFLAEARSYEDALDRARIFADEQRFLIGVRLLTGTVTPVQAGFAFTDLGEVSVERLHARAEQELAARHGRMPGGASAVLALGKLGGREITATSDLDLILIYDHDAEATGSDGPKALAPSQYYGRLTQRLVAAISAPTAEGRLYEVDLRLRPSGRSGPLATHFDSFADYQAQSAWTWEHMALTRARVVSAPDVLSRRIEVAIRDILTRKRDRPALMEDVRAMRGRVEREKPNAGLWDIKLVPGGLLDIEFIAQALQLVHAHDSPNVLDPNTEAALGKLAEAGHLAATDLEILLPACRLYIGLTQLIRLCVEGTFKPEEAPRGLRDMLARAGELPDFAPLEAHLNETQSQVRAAFVRLVGDPAAEIPDQPR